MTAAKTHTQDTTFVIDKDSGVPIWLQLRNRLVYLITSGYYAVGDKIPTVREMAVAANMNYNTVSKVYHDMERDGYIISLRGKGTFVHDGYQEGSDADDQATNALVDDFIRQCIELGVVRRDIPALVESRLGDA